MDLRSGDEAEKDWRSWVCCCCSDVEEEDEAIFDRYRRRRQEDRYRVLGSDHRSWPSTSGDSRPCLVCCFRSARSSSDLSSIS